MIQLQDLVKDYGDVRAVDRINFEIRKGEILGFLGPNGAGKSTTLKTLTCYLNPTSGNIFVGDYNINEHSQQIRKMIGYLPENNPLYTDMTVYDFLIFVSEAREIPSSEIKQNLKKVVLKTGLSSVISKPIHALSKGYRQRVGLAQAILHNPQILVLDEPTTGLDPNQIVEIRELIKELGKDKTLIISSHILQEVQAVCDRIVIIDKGKIVADGSTEQLKSGHQEKTTIKLELTGDLEGIRNTFTQLPGIEVEVLSSSDISHMLNLHYADKADRRTEIYNVIKSQPWQLLEMQREKVSLEDVFRSLTGRRD